ncbi:unnamed protein product [Rotaria sordida]|uniref:Uncharacterized protein n=1 Tax=Rotaria sordida TaxID=392033 RepID=A0A815FX83_9BILA|nr:unnamed protein product [Rotaria sordida]
MNRSHQLLIVRYTSKIQFKTGFVFICENEFRRNQVRGIPKVRDCAGNSRLYLGGSVSALADALIEFSIVFKGPDEYATNDNGFLALEMAICKSRNSMFECSDGQNTGICQIERFPSGNTVKIDHEQLSLWKINENRNSTNETFKPITPTKLAKFLKVYTVYIIGRETYLDADKGQYVPENNFRILSNAFTPNSLCKAAQSNNSLSGLHITQVKLSQNENINQYDLQVSVIIPEMYRCTQLKNKYLEVKICTGNEQDLNIHPDDKLLDNQTPVDSRLIPVDEYNSTFVFNIIKLTGKESVTNFISNQTQPIPSTIQTITFNNVSFASSEEVHTISSQESDSSPDDDNSTDDHCAESSTHVKQSYQKETHERTESPEQKIQKTDIVDTAFDDMKCLID